MRLVRWVLVGSALSLVSALASPPARAAGRMTRVQTAATLEVAGWDGRIQALQSSGDLRLRQARADTLVAGRQHERFAQFHRGVRVFGGELVRQSDPAGPLSVFGTFYEGIEIDTRPTLSGEQARASVRTPGTPRLLVSRAPELLVLPESDGSYALCWMFREWTTADLVLFFVDAHDGRVRRRLSDLKKQSAVGLGKGVLGDSKKVSARSSRRNLRGRR